MKVEIISSKDNFSIQKRTGLILFIFIILVVILNFINLKFNWRWSTEKAFKHIAVLPNLAISIIFLLTSIKNYKVLRYTQIFIILLAGIFTIIITTPGNQTGVLILLLGIALAYQYGFFASKVYVKTTVLLVVYITAILSNVFIVNKVKLPFGIPSILFSLTTVYLFWMVFSEEIRLYLIQTNQLRSRLGFVESENARLEVITEKQAMQIQEKNRILEKNLEEKTLIEKELRKTLSVKNLLLQEVHHRVKNNLSLIISLLNLQKTDDPVISDFIKTNSNRLYAMAAVHETIYQEETSESVNLADYFKDILKNLLKIYVQNDSINTNVSMENIEVPMDIAVPLGVIFNDCVSNSIIYGLSRKADNKAISIILKKDPDIAIEISDNGNRIPRKTKPPDKDISFSMKLTKILVEDQLNGSLKTEFKNGNVWRVRVPWSTDLI